MVVPLNGSPSKTNRGTGTGWEILRGVAQAQSEWNSTPNHSEFKLRVLIADDANQVAKPGQISQAQRVAQTLVSKSQILAVIGHYTSDVTLDTLPFYQSPNSGQPLVLISSTSTASKLTTAGLQPNHVFFRTVSTTDTEAYALVNYLRVEDASRHEKVAIFYNPNSPYSNNLKTRFENSFEDSGGQVKKLPQFDLSQHSFNATTAIAQASQAGVTALGVFPDGHTSTDSFKNALKLIEINRGRFRLVSGNSLYDYVTLGKEASQSLVTVVPWHILAAKNQVFVKAARQTWGAEVNWRSATSYDAVKVIAAAFKKHPRPSREELQQVLADPQFSVERETASGPIHFEGGDRKESMRVLVKVVPTQNCSDKYLFVPLKHPAANKNLVVCQR